MWKKIVQRIPYTKLSPEIEFVALIDLIELELGLSTGRKSVRTRLSEIASELQDGKSISTPECLDTLLDAIKRLEKIEGYMRDSGFETARDTSADHAPD